MSVVQGYSTSAQTQNALDGLRWVADYFVKCHHSDVAYTGQVRALSHCLTLVFTSVFPSKTTTTILGPRKNGTRGVQHSDCLTFAHLLSSAQWLMLFPVCERRFCQVRCKEASVAYSPIHAAT